MIQEDGWHGFAMAGNEHGHARAGDTTMEGGGNNVSSKQPPRNHIIGPCKHMITHGLMWLAGSEQWHVVV